MGNLFDKSNKSGPKTRSVQPNHTLAKRWNCSNRFFGRNVNKEYFVVLILLDLKLRFGCPFALDTSLIKVLTIKHAEFINIILGETLDMDRYYLLNYNMYKCI
jgi:hypothetical protein